MCVETMTARAEDRHEQLIGIGARVRQLRLARGLTQADLANLTGIHRVNISQFENGKIDLGISNAYALATALGVMPEELFHG